jgi:hypothetical protein
VNTVRTTSFSLDRVDTGRAVRYRRGSRLVVALVVALTTAGCGDDPSDVPTAETTAGTTATTRAPAAATTTEPRPPDTSGPDTVTPDTVTPDTVDPGATTTTEAEIPIPTGQLVAVPQQNREDPAKQQFQVQIVNGTQDRFQVVSVQFVWDGFTSPPTTRDSIVVRGQVIDFPVPFPGATCAGDGTLASMPSLDDAVVLLGLDDGTVREVPVIDRWHLARRLYLEDCQRQFIDRQVAIEWVDLHEEQYEDRPVTAGELRLTRRDGTGTISIESVSGTIPYDFEAVDTDPGQTVITLDAGTASVSVPIRFVEGRCDPHALAEVKQPHKFVAQVDLGDGVLLPYIIVPPEDMFVPMRLTADAACVATGQVVFVGDESG